MRAPAAGSGRAPCTCVHSREAHEHLRRGTDCALCECRRYRPATRGARLPAGLLAGASLLWRRRER